MGTSTPSPRHAKVEIAARTHRGVKRENNEDAFLVFKTGRYLERIQSSIPEADLSSRYEEGGYLMAVADGMGGVVAGEVASREALLAAFRMTLRAPKWLLSLDDPAERNQEVQAFYDRVKGYLAGMHAELLRLGSDDPRKAGMGTTFTAAYSLGYDLFVVHVGDSRVYLRNGEALRQLTHDHTLAQRLADSGAIPQEKVATHPERNVLTQVVGGAGGWLRGETHHVRLEPGDKVLVCTDGLTGPVGEDDIARILDGAPSSEAACQALIERTLERGAPDNVTVIVARYGAPDEGPQGRPMPRGRRNSLQM